MKIKLRTGVTLSYNIFGAEDDPVVVLVPGQHQASLFDDMQVPYLVKGGYRVVTFDLRGVAPSEETPPPYTMPQLAEDIAALVEALELPACAFVGYSLGAMMLLELSMSKPELMTRVALVGVPWKPSALQRAIRTEALERLSSGTPIPAVLEGVYRAMYLFGPRALNRDAFIGPYLEGLQGIAASGGHGAVGHAEASVNYEPTPEQLATISVPMLIVGMEHDIVAPRHLARELAALIDSCEYTEIRNCGHAALLEKPTETNSILTRYLADGTISQIREPIRRA